MPEPDPDAPSIDFGGELDHLTKQILGEWRRQLRRGAEVREFRDSSGREWRTWDVTPDNLEARTKDEDFLGLAPK